ncbi:MAG: hypothetical protein NVS4B3_09040 [Gemmatimonadaceae bacterium]
MWAAEVLFRLVPSDLTPADPVSWPGVVVEAAVRLPVSALVGIGVFNVGAIVLRAYRRWSGRFWYRDRVP